MFLKNLLKSMICFRTQKGARCLHERGIKTAKPRTRPGLLLIQAVTLLAKDLATLLEEVAVVMVAPWKNGNRH